MNCVDILTDMSFCTFEKDFEILFRDDDFRTVRVRTEDSNRRHFANVFECVKCKAVISCRNSLSIDSVECVKFIDGSSISCWNCCVRQRCRQPWNISTWLCLRKYFDLSALVVLLFLIQFSWIGVDAAPTSPKAQSTKILLRMARYAPYSSEPRWIRPCASETSLADDDDDTNYDEELYMSIKRDIKNAYSSIEREINKFISQNVFPGPLEFQISSTQDKKLPWLETDWIPKSKTIGVNVSDEEYEQMKKNLHVVIPQIYHHFQLLDASLELAEVEWPPEQTIFTELRKKMKFILCDLNVVIRLHDKMVKIPNVERSMIPNDYKDIDQTGKLNRDWLILRDYMNFLEFTLGFFEKLSKHANNV